MSNFLPEGYDKIPSSSRYMKLQDGKNTFRVLTSAVTGWVYWNTGNKPVRLKDRPSGRPLDMRADEDETVKHFWAFAVWNYTEKMVQVLEITQKQIMTGLKALVDDDNWGDPKNYDITITRSGSGFDTEYITQGVPPKPMDPKIAEEFARNPVNLTAIFNGGDPFAGKPATEEAVDGPGFEEPAIEITEGAAPTDRYKTVPDQFKPQA